MSDVAPEFTAPVDDIVAAVRDLDLRNAQLEQENADLRNLLEELVQAGGAFPVARVYERFFAAQTRSRTYLSEQRG